MTTYATYLQRAMYKAVPWGRTIDSEDVRRPIGTGVVQESRTLARGMLYRFIENRFDLCPTFRCKLLHGYLGFLGRAEVGLTER